MSWNKRAIWEPHFNLDLDMTFYVLGDKAQWYRAAIIVIIQVTMYLPNPD